jgi:hypothetical protein
MILQLKAAPGDMRQPEDFAGDHTSSPPSPPLFDRRRETRYATTETVEVSLLDAARGPRFSGTVLDVSHSGLRVETATPISKGVRIEIVLRERAVIFGKARYCRRSSALYHVGVSIEVVYYAQPVIDAHTRDTELNLYIAGRGLTVLEAIRVKNHLLTCALCQDRLRKAQTAYQSGSRTAG